MSNDIRVRAVDGDDAGRIQEIASSTFTADYALSPADIETLVEAEFTPDRQRDRLEDGDTAGFVAELDAEGGSVFAGFVEVGRAEGDDEPAVRWLHVDPERRGMGVGTALFEQALSELSDRGVEEPRALALADNTSSGAFFERFDFGRVGQRTVEFGGRDLVEYVYVEGAVEQESPGETETADDPTAGEADADDTHPDADPQLDRADLPETVTAEGGETVSLGEDPLPGSEGGFLQTFTDDGDEHGYYCLNCGSTDVSMDSMEQIQCEECANTHKPDEEYDGSYL